jgi:NAD-dependent deacetylase
MHGELFKSRCDSCTRPPFEDTDVYELPLELPRCSCGGGIRPHICWFGEVPFELETVFRALDRSTVFMAIGTSGTVEPAASFAAHVRGHARTIYVGPEEPSNRFAFTECHLAKAGEVLPKLLETA